MSSEKKRQEGSLRLPSTDHLNNVTKMDRQGHREALCPCGVNFTVTESRPLTIERGDETIYVHNQECVDHFRERSPKDQQTMLVNYWERQFPFQTLATNEYQEGGKEKATCICGTTVTVTKDTPRITENGLNIYLCSDACNTALHGMSPQERKDFELKNYKIFETHYARSA